MEAVALTLVGASVGVASGTAVAFSASWLIKLLNPAWVPSFSLPAVAVALVASSAVGLFFGWFPAMRAAESEPIACLRHE
jgi:putative ABC transport system permease protein